MSFTGFGLWIFCSEVESSSTLISSTKLQVYPTPKIAVLSTGDEVVEPAVQALNRGQVMEIF